MPTSCRVWATYQARCILCNWSGEVTGDREDAADDASDHRRTQEHRDNLKGKGR